MDSKEFIKKAKKLVADSHPNREIWTGDVRVVWSAKVLQNNKAILTTTDPDGLLYEIAYSEGKDEFYVDIYEKVGNKTIRI